MNNKDWEHFTAVEAFFTLRKKEFRSGVGAIQIPKWASKAIKALGDETCQQIYKRVMKRK